MVTNYGTAEVPVTLFGDVDAQWQAGYCGRQRDGFECRLIDEHDNGVPNGHPGELVVRSDAPGWLAAGYHNNSEADAAAWRNDWFHTGDVFRRDEEGRFFLVDRIDDTVRRNGENISSAEIESELVVHPLVGEAACVPYRVEGDIDDAVKVWIVSISGANIDPAELLAFCADRMPHFMVPRYFEFVDILPKTPSHTVMKGELRRRGNAPGDTWDREEHGYQVTRDGLRRDASLTLG